MKILRPETAHLGKAFAEPNGEKDNVHKIDLDGKTVVLIGTAHVSGKSTDLVRRIIEEEKPDAVSIELCQTRYATLTRYGLSQELNLLSLSRQVLRLFLPWFMIWTIQKKVGRKLGIRAGAEILGAIEAAKASGIRIYPVDRDFLVTLTRAWRLMNFRTKIALATEFALSLRSVDRIKEEDIEGMKREDALETLMAEFGESFPGLRQAFIDERDQYMAREIKALPEGKIVALVGAAHVPGILRQWRASA